MLTAFLALVWAALLVLRVVVTDREVQCAVRAVGPKIAPPRSPTARWSTTTGSASGAGAGATPTGTWAYTLMGEGRRVVEITWKENCEVRARGGVPRTPTIFAASINEAGREETPTRRECRAWREAAVGEAGEAADRASEATGSAPRRADDARGRPRVTCR